MAERNIPFNQLAKAGYNRGIKRKQVNKIKSEYHEDMVQPAIVSFRDGKYFIVDGQHRSQAKYELNGNDPNTPILCDVRTGMTYEQEADLYYRLNTGSRKLSFADELTGLIESKDAHALKFQSVIESCGYVIGGNNVNSLRAISTAWKIFNRNGGDEKLTTILTLTHSCWPNSKNGAHSTMIDGISLFLDCHGASFQTETFVKNLSDADPKSLINDATAYYKNTTNKLFTKPFCMYTMIINQYNYGLRTNKLTQITPGA